MPAPYTVKTTRQVDAFLKKHAHEIGRFKKALLRLQFDLLPGDSEHLEDVRAYKMRIGNYRALYRLDIDCNTIVVFDLDRRESVYSKQYR